MTRVGIALVPEVNPAVDDRWARIEEYGFAHAWCLDHLAWRTLADSAWHATVPTLAAAAMTTRRLTLGVFVASPNFRHPVPFSKEVMTLDVMSGGRFLVGLGPGTTSYDATILGTPEITPGQRIDRLEEFATLLDQLLRQPRTTWSGTWFSAVDAPTIPGPTQRPRPGFVIAANRPRGMRLAARRGDGWVTMGSAPFGSEPEAWWSGVVEAKRRFDEVAAAAGGTPTEFRRFLDIGAGPGPADSASKMCDDVARAHDLGFTDVVIPWARRSEPYHRPERIFEELAGQLDDHGELRS
jgi:alkanesulfonate monooxygenase SsuD/methylene tetrahydromethanopterin reductase-like flavin-dependent oxidoreductase (luciferase family)